MKLSLNVHKCTMVRISADYNAQMKVCFQKDIFPAFKMRGESGGLTHLRNKTFEGSFPTFAQSKPPLALQFSEEQGGSSQSAKV